ncbi:hypothetical protein [Thermophagus xiamenensis]|jgi:hypothetical protein|uniref:Uncharacterized protein n=1 Tax=Thermophagus xiamenensis TaxID=385682 RepID=A0A1I2E472_9BACT|nr:hypothetical protein [Thermophagus xiamenensis]SFE87020.1 hypothetical protein SAMN05444380_12118 [Thermophagus xiamenensis]
MKRKLALSFLLVFTLAITAPVMSSAAIQEPEKTEKKACDKEKPCCEKEKKACDKKAEKKECSKACDKKAKEEKK